MKMILVAVLLVAVCLGSSSSQQFYYGIPNQGFYNSQLQRAAPGSFQAYPAFSGGYPYPYAYNYPAAWGYVPADEQESDEVEARTKKLKVKLLKPFILKAAALNAIKNGGILGIVGAPFTLPGITIPVPALPANLLPASASISLNQQDVTIPGVGITTSLTQGGTTNTNNFVLPG